MSLRDAAGARGDEAREHQAMGPGPEFDTIRALMARWGALAVDIGDDAAVLPDFSADASGRRTVVSTDACIEGAHFLDGWLTPKEVGGRAVAAALSDLAAMGARAEAILVAMVVPDRWRDSLAEVADGIAAVLRPTGARIIGGNLSRGDAFGITTTVIGSTARPVSRRGAQPGDRLLITGVLGGPGQAVAALYAGAIPATWARTRFAAPVPRLAEGQLLAEAGVHGMLDVSDGLVADARHLAAASGVRLRIDSARLPVGAGVSTRQALESGEEYELLVAAPVEVARGLHARWASVSGVALTDIGEVVGPCEDGAVVVVGDSVEAGRVEFVLGHDHFTS